jgi:hypothetical protein
MSDKKAERWAPQPMDVLETKEVARWIKASERTVRRQGLPHLPGMPGKYLVADILAHWQAKKGKAA